VAAKVAGFLLAVRAFRRFNMMVGASFFTIIIIAAIVLAVIVAVVAFAVAAGSQRPRD
jgi:hypothetical protein